MRSASLQEDRHSITSASSSCSAHDILSQRSAGSQLRKFTASVGKPGQAREVREAVRAVMTLVNPTRKPPIAQPLDYETFVTEKSSQLDNDSQRDLLLFPRDDIGESDAIESLIPPLLEQGQQEPAWLLTQEALKLYSASTKTVEFNYASFSGDYDSRADELVGDLSPLSFESDLVIEEERAALEGQAPQTSDIICEGYLFVVPENGLLDNFKGTKKRYCLFKKGDEGIVMLELRKAPSIPSQQPPFPVKQVYLSKTKKGKSVLEVITAEEEQRTFSFAADVDSDLSRWLFEVDRALAGHKDDTASISSFGLQSIACTSSGENENNLSDEDGNSAQTGGKESGAVFRGKNAHLKALQPPVVQRHNIFALYIDLDPLPGPRGEPCSLLLPLEGVRNKSDSRADKHVVRFTVEVTKVDVKLPPTISGGQVEPFFVRVFLFDARTGKRMSEEFRMSPRFGASYSPEVETTSESRSSLEEDGFSGISHSILSDPNASKIIYSVAQPHPDVYVVIRVERNLSSDYTGELYTKTNADVKTITKQIKNLQQAAPKLSRFRMPFAFAARPAFQDMLGGGSKLPEEIPLYRWDGSKTSDGDLQKVLNDLSKSEKSGKLTAIPGSTISLLIDISARVTDFPMRISPSFTPIYPWNAAPDTLISATFQMQAFNGIISDPYNNLVNILYVYPLLLKYDNQKVFSKARNISCTVQFIASAERGGNTVKAIYDRFAYPTPFSQCARCAVQHHEQNPAFGDEVKIQLPLTLDCTDHLLFTFTHIAVSSAAQKSVETVETPAGFAWLPLVKNERLVMENDEQEVALPVAVDLPDGYITYQSLGLGKGHIGPDIRWVDGGKPLFRVRLRLISSAFTTEGRLQSFFQGCQKLQKVDLPTSSSLKSGTSEESGSPRSNATMMSTDEVEYEKCNRYVSKKAQSLLDVEIDRLIPFLPIVLGRLLSLLPSCATDDMAVTVLTTLIGIVDRTMVVGRTPLLRTFIKQQFQSTTAKSLTLAEEETTHSAICKYVSLLAKNAQGDLDALAAIFRQLWFLLDVAVKSMAQRLIDAQLYKAPRRERFSEQLFFRIRFFIEQLVPLVVAKHREIPHETRIANTAIAYFLRCCLSFLDRGSVFSWIHYMVTRFDETESRHLREYKLDLLQILAGHEHWLPLALPLLCDSAGELMKRDKDASIAERNASAGGSGVIANLFSRVFSFSPAEEYVAEANPYLRFTEEFTLTEGYCARHFLVGLLLQELQCSFREPRDYRKRAIALIRNILAKHSIDKRYKDARAQTRIATLYAPLLRLVLDNMGEMETSLKSFDYGEQPSMAVPSPSAATSCSKFFYL